MMNDDICHGLDLRRWKKILNFLAKDEIATFGSLSNSTHRTFCIKSTSPDIGNETGLQPHPSPLQVLVKANLPVAIVCSLPMYYKGQIIDTKLMDNCWTSAKHWEKCPIHGAQHKWICQGIMLELGNIVWNPLIYPGLSTRRRLKREK